MALPGVKGLNQCHRGEWGALPRLKSQIRQKLSKKNGIKFGRCTFRLKNYIKILPPSHFFRIFSTGAATASSFPETINQEYISRYSQGRKRSPVCRNIAPTCYNIQKHVFLFKETKNLRQDCQFLKIIRISVLRDSYEFLTVL